MPSPVKEPDNQSLLFFSLRNTATLYSVDISIIFFLGALKTVLQMIEELCHTQGCSSWHFAEFCANSSVLQHYVKKWEQRNCEWHSNIKTSLNLTRKKFNVLLLLFLLVFLPQHLTDKRD